MNFNTAISAMMVFVNGFSGENKPLPREAAEKFTLLLAPFAPHVGEELWERLGHGETLAYEKWPEFDEKHLSVDEVEVLVQICGKPKSRIKMPAAATPADMEKIAMADEKVSAALVGKTVIKTVCVPGRLVNIVAK
jgi:leucyl-tRNA synthetase